MMGLAIAGTVALGSEGDRGVSAAPVAASENEPPHTGCAEGTQAARPKRGRDLIAGPVAFFKLVNRNGEAIADSDYFQREPGERYTGFKVGALVERSTVATIVIPRSERPELKIDYALGHPPGFASTLEACDDRRTGFPGGFKVHGPLCSKLRVRVVGRATPITKPVSFGGGDCPAG
jgi:hypothetical protein